MSDEELKLRLLEMSLVKYSGDQAIKMANLMFEYIRSGDPRGKSIRESLEDKLRKQDAILEGDEPK